MLHGEFLLLLLLCIIINVKQLLPLQAINVSIASVISSLFLVGVAACDKVAISIVKLSESGSNYCWN